MKSIPWDHMDDNKNIRTQCLNVNYEKVPQKITLQFYAKNTVLFEKLSFSVVFFSHLHLGAGYRYSLLI